MSQPINLISALQRRTAKRGTQIAILEEERATLRRFVQDAKTLGFCESYYEAAAQLQAVKAVLAEEAFDQRVDRMLLKQQYLVTTKLLTPKPLSTSQPPPSSASVKITPVPRPFKVGDVVQVVNNEGNERFFSKGAVGVVKAVDEHLLICFNGLGNKEGSFNTSNSGSWFSDKSRVTLLIPAGEKYVPKPGDIVRFVKGDRNFFEAGTIAQVKYNGGEWEASFRGMNNPVGSFEDSLDGVWYFDPEDAIPLAIY